MAETVDLTVALSNEVSRLERVLAMNMKVGDNPPGESQLSIIKEQIVLLKDEIEQGNAKVQK